MIRPLVSVITPVYNAEKFLSQLIKSTRNQNGINLEHILVDDCSTDNSLALLNELAITNPFIKVITLSVNSGPVVARNVAIKESSGKFLAFLDADDYWLPEKCSTQTTFMIDKGAAISFSDYRFISENGRLIGRRLSGFDTINWILHHMSRYLGCLTIMIDRDRCPNFIFPTINPAYRAEDFLAWSSVLLQHGIAYRCPHDLARYRQVQSSRSSAPLSGSMSVWKLYRNIEKIPFFKSLFYFAIYSTLSLYKRIYCHPIWPSKSIDGKLSNDYKLP